MMFKSYYVSGAGVTVRNAQPLRGWSYDGGGVPLLELEPGACRWPTEPGLFCGERAVRGSYCARHGKRAYVG